MIAAVVIGLVAAGALWSYISGIEDRAYDDAKLVQVFRVDKDIEKGAAGETALSDDFIVSDKIPQEYRPGTALTDLESIKGKVALTNLSAGQVVVDGMFVDPRVAQVSFSQRIPAGQVAITVSVDEVHGVAGLLVPGDKVNILVSSTEGQQFLFQNVNILAIGSTAAPEPGQTQAVTNPGSNLITFAVPPLAAEKIAFVGGGGGAAGIYLTLVPPDNKPVKVPPVNADNLFDGKLTPYAK